MAIKKIGFIVDKLPAKTETSRLALTHAIASQTVEIYLEDGENVEPILAFVGDGVLNCVKNQKAFDVYTVTSLEMHIKNALLLDMDVFVCKEDIDRLGIKQESLIMDAEDLGGEKTTQIISFSEIMDKMNSADHLLFF